VFHFSPLCNYSLSRVDGVVRAEGKLLHPERSAGFGCVWRCATALAPVTLVPTYKRDTLHFLSKQLPKRKENDDQKCNC
jgi:hypothetical protein